MTNQLALPTVFERAQLGATLLTNVYGPLWYTRIYLRDLNISNVIHCILGQLYTDYYIGEKKLGLSTEASWQHGFTWKDGVDYQEDQPTLEDAWTVIIQECIESTLC